MDKDRIKGSAEQAKGKVKEWAGKITGDSKTEAEGKADQVKGKVQNTIGGIKDTVRGRIKANFDLYSGAPNGALFLAGALSPLAVPLVVSHSSLELDRVRHGAGSAAGAAHGDQDVLLLLLVEVGSGEHLSRLLLEQVMEREPAVRDLILRRLLISRLGGSC